MLINPWVQLSSMICVSSWLSLHQSLSRGIIYLFHMGPESHFLLNYQDIYNLLPWSGTVTVIAALTAWHNALQSVVMATMPSTASQKLFTLNMLLGIKSTSLLYYQTWAFQNTILYLMC